MKLQEAIAQAVRLIAGASYRDFDRRAATESWAFVLSDEDPAAILRATRAALSRNREFPPQPGEILLECLRERAPSFKLHSSEAFFKVNTSYVDGGPLNIPTRVAIECDFMRPAGWGTYAAPADGTDRSVAQARFNQAWTDLLGSPERARDLVREVLAINAAAAAGRPMLVQGRVVDDEHGAPLVGGPTTLADALTGPIARLRDPKDSAQ